MFGSKKPSVRLILFDKVEGETMSRVFSGGVLGLAFAMTFVAGPSCTAQQVHATPAGPVPVQIASAKKVFISNAGGEEIDPKNFFLPSMDPNQPYDRFYAALQSAGRYTAVPVPSDADLVLEIRFTFPVLAREAQVVGNVRDPRLRLTIFDPKTHALLWAISERVAASAGPHWKEKREANFDQAIAALLDDMTKLSLQPRP
jgi:hypothetical protein